MVSLIKIRLKIDINIKVNFKSKFQHTKIMIMMVNLNKFNVKNIEIKVKHDKIMKFIHKV